MARGQQATAEARTAIKKDALQALWTRCRPAGVEPWPCYAQRRGCWERHAGQPSALHLLGWTLCMAGTARAPPVLAGLEWAPVLPKQGQRWGALPACKTRGCSVCDSNLETAQVSRCRVPRDGPAGASGGAGGPRCQQGPGVLGCASHEECTAQQVQRSQRWACWGQRRGGILGQEGLGVLGPC